MQSEPSSGIKLTAYSCICWLFHRVYYDARNHKHKVTLMPHTFELYIQQHSINVTYMGLDRCQIIGYSGLLDGVYTSYSCCCFYTWAAQLIRGVCSLDISFICSFRIVVSTAEEVDGVGDKGSGDAKRLMYIHFWRPF